MRVSILRLMMLWWCVLTLASCALPVPAGEELGDFVPDDERLVVSLVLEGISYMNGSRFVDAELRFRQALYMRPDLENVSANLAAALERVGNYDEAETIYKSLIEKEPKSIPYEIGLAKVYASAGRYGDAIEQFDRARIKAIDANDAGNWANAARSMSTLEFTIGDEESAVCHSSETVALRASPDEVLRNIRLLIATQRFDDAIDYILTASANQGMERNTTVLHNRAMLAFEQGKFSDVLALEQLAALSGGIDPAILFEITMVRNFSLLQLPVEREKAEFDEDAEAEFYETLLELRDGNTAMTLYWPPSVVALFFTAGELNETQDELS